MITTLTIDGHKALICLKGDFTTDEAEGFQQKTAPVMAGGFDVAVMDLADLEFISSTGIRCFIMLLKACESKGTALKLRNLTPQIQDIFSLTALLDRFDIE